MVRWLALACLMLSARAAGAADLAPDQKSAICGSRMTCAVIAVTDAAKDRAGQNLAVVEVRFGLADKPKGAPDEGCTNDSGAADGPDRDGGHEFWLLEGSAAPKRLLALCNDGYGAAGVGEDDIKVGPNMITTEQMGGSAWRWDVTKQILLSPLHVVHEHDCTFNTIGPGTGQVREVDRRSLQAVAVGYIGGKAPSGDAAGNDSDGDCPDWPTGPDQVLPRGPQLAGAYSIPMPNGDLGSDGQGVPMPDGVALGDCALQLSTDGLHGFLVFGQAATPENAAMLRVIAETETSLLVQLDDPTAAAELATGKANSWVGQPHIELWTGQPSEADAAASDQGPSTVYGQFAVGLDDKVYPGAGTPGPLPKVAHWAAKDEAGRPVVVYRLKWDSGEGPFAWGLGIVYSQAKGGKQARLVSNAQIKKNQPLYLPETWINTPEESGIPSETCTLGADRILTLSKTE